LEIDVFEALDSKGNYLIQIADLFTSSINRILNTFEDGTMPKDIYAKKFLESFGIDISGSQIQSDGDLAVHIYM